MSGRWTETLAEPLARVAGGRPWVRIDRSRDGRWLLLSPRGPGDWYAADERAGTLAPLSPFEDDALPGLRKAAERAWRRGVEHRLLAWRPGRRAVLRTSGRGGTWITKVYRKDRDLLRRWKAPGSNNGARWRVPEVLGFDPHRRALRVEWVSGRSLNERWLAGEGRASDGETIADLLDWIGGTAVPEGLPRYGPADEIRLLRSRLESFHETLAAPPAEAAELVRRVTGELAGLPLLPPAFCHRDLHDKQILLDGGSGALLDLDLAAAGPPGLDAGNILAHLRLRSLKGASLPWREIAAAVRAASARRAPAGPALHVWTASALLRLALIYARRRRPEGLIERLLASCADALEGRGEWAGLLPVPAREGLRPCIND